MELHDAKVSLREDQVEEAQEEGAEPPTIKGVVSAARNLVEAAAGKPFEADATVILTAAEKLDQIAQTSASARPAELVHGLQEIQAKVEAMKPKL